MESLVSKSKCWFCKDHENFENLERKSSDEDLLHFEYRCKNYADGCPFVARLLSFHQIEEHEKDCKFMFTKAFNDLSTRLSCLEGICSQLRIPAEGESQSSTEKPVKSGRLSQKEITLIGRFLKAYVAKNFSKRQVAKLLTEQLQEKGFPKRNFNQIYLYVLRTTKN